MALIFAMAEDNCSSARVCAEALPTIKTKASRRKTGNRFFMCITQIRTGSCSDRVAVYRENTFFRTLKPVATAPGSDLFTTEQLDRFARIVSQNNIRAGAFDAGERLHHHALLIDPTILRGRFDHRVLAGNVISAGG